jgi:para-aminobenzoate synthetase component 1
MQKEDLRKKLNNYGKNKKPCLFIIDFDINNFFIYSLNNIPDDIFYKFDNFENIPKKNTKILKNQPIKIPISFNEYKIYFNLVQQKIRKGYTYLLNLTFPTQINIKSLSLKDIIINTQARFKIYFKDKFISFSPERFIKIQKNTIFTYPIKGTIDAKEPNAKEKILANIKEKAEHTMIVDLLRNDLGIIGKDIKVNSFRDIENINAGDKELLQVSSNIQASLNQDWQEKLGDIIISILPAGSITGTPKQKTIQIINEIETQYDNYKRGFFCGICGYFDGQNVDSFVMIRFIEKENDKYIYKSGGGITVDSDVLSEYEEMKQKVYIPYE